jgi:hypothetical protein
MRGASFFQKKTQKYSKNLSPAARRTILTLGEDGDMDNPVVFLHGFSDTALFDLVTAIKKAAREAGIDPGLIAFASSTPTNMGWKIKDLIREVRQEHEMMNKGNK